MSGITAVETRGLKFTARCDKPTFVGDLPAPDTLFIRMTRGSHETTEQLRRQYATIRRVVVDVDGERHEYNANALIALLEAFEDGEVPR